MAAKSNDPLDRFLLVTKWYLSGFHLKPEGVKKPWNPILGEVFRCKIQSKDGTSSAFFVAEQVSHHPPVSAYYLEDRKAGFVVQGSVSLKSKFFGTSIGCELVGGVTVHLLHTNEKYTIQFPSAQCKGFIIGPLTVELTGEVDIDCQETGIHGQLEFKKKGMFGKDYNVLYGKIHDSSHSKPILFLQGHWDGDIFLSKQKDVAITDRSLFWAPKEGVSLQREIYLPKTSQLREFESEIVWHSVNNAILTQNEVEGNAAKLKIEEEQRIREKHRLDFKQTWQPKLFSLNSQGFWTYNWFNSRLWSSDSEDSPFEHDGIIQSIQKSSSN